jgi:hypothetical protein
MLRRAIPMNDTKLMMRSVVASTGISSSTKHDEGERD